MLVRVSELSVALPGGAMVVVAIARYWVPLAAGYLQQAGGEVSRHPLPEPLARELQNP